MSQKTGGSPIETAVEAPRMNTAARAWSGGRFGAAGRLAILVLAVILTTALSLRINSAPASADPGTTRGNCDLGSQYGPDYAAFNRPPTITIVNPPVVRAMNLTSGIDTQTFSYTLFLYYWSAAGQWLPVRDQSGNPVHGQIYSIEVSESSGWLPGVPQLVNATSGSDVKVEIPTSGWYYAATDQLWAVSKSTGLVVYNTGQQWISLTRPDGTSGYYCKF